MTIDVVSAGADHGMGVEPSAGPVKRRGFVRRLFSSKVSGSGIVLLALIVLVVVLGPVFWTADPHQQDLLGRFGAPSGEHPLGTDALGRDVLSRVLYGGRLSLSIAAIAVVLSLLTGTAIGLVAGFVGGWVDSLIMRIMDILLSIPSLLLAVAIAAALGAGTSSLILAVVIPGIPGDARLVRSVVKSVRERDFVFAARAAGVRPSRIVVRHVLANSMSTIVTNAAIGFGFILLIVGALGYLGIGAQPPTIEWGLLLADSQQYLFNRPIVAIVPGLAIFLTALGANLAGDALRDAFDPSR
jgi:peptide/nickel transport system permease protein